MYLTKLLFSFKGSLTRLEYVWGLIISMALVSFFVFLPSPFQHIPNTSNWVEMTNQINKMEDAVKLLSALSYIIGITIYCISNLAIATKRLRDLHWNLWLSPLFIIPFIGFIMKMLGIFVPSKIESRNKDN